MATLQEHFDFELMCGHCGTDLGTFLRGDDFAEEPHMCPSCYSRHLTRAAVPATTEWARWETLIPAKGTRATVRPRFLLTAR